MMRIDQSASATMDIAGVVRHLAQADAIHAADRFLDALQTTYEHLASFPGMGALVELPEPQKMPLRHMQLNRHTNWYVLYRVYNDCVRIVRVLHGSQDLVNALNPRSQP